MDAEELGYEVLYLIAHSSGGLGHWANVLSTHDEATDKNTEGRDRGLFPLPMPATCQRLVRASCEKSREERPRAPADRKHRPSRTAHLPWLAVLIIAVNWMAFGCLASAPVRKPTGTVSAGQRRTIEHLTGLAQRFVSPDEPGKDVPCSPAEPFGQRLGTKRPDYLGNAVLKAYPLTAAQVEPGLPPPGLGGRLWALDGISGDLQYFVEDARRLLLPEDQLPDEIPQPRVMVESQEEWELIVTLLYKAGILREMPLEDVPVVRGRPLLQGAFGVGKPGKTIADGRVLLRFIMD